MSTDCIFCKIAKGEIPSDKVYEDDLFLGFRDIHPEAPSHTIVIPKKHVATMNDVTGKDSALLAGFLLACQRIARSEKIDESGYRVVINCNKDGDQYVFHLHAHLLGGRHMGWPPG